MGVTSLWQIVHPCARPIKLETLNRKRLAVDASIWIYQFLKAVRDKEGNALRNSHVVGFFRRICKLLFFGIKPVFVFDGGAPALKRQTISARKQRREGRREDAVRTAGKLLAVQMQRRAEEEEQKRKDGRNRDVDEEEVPDEGLVYAEENYMTQQERQQGRKFRKKDAYDLPEMEGGMTGGANDPRVMSLEELQAYAKQFETGEDINVYDFSKIDYDSPFFMSLPASDRYNILNAARLRSRLRMGYSKEQLESMFPDKMAFSMFQIDRVRERADLTNRLMHLNEGGDDLYNGGRVAGEKGREYVLVKNDGVEGGWALGVIGDEGTKQETAIDLDKPAPAVKDDDEEWEDEGDFEDVPIEGLNRLPKRERMESATTDGFAKRRKHSHKSTKSTTKRKPTRIADPNSLFVQDDPAEVDEEQWEELAENTDLFGEDADEEEDEDLRRAIAMSLENDPSTTTNHDHAEGGTSRSDAEDEDVLEVFNQTAVPEARPIPKGGGRAIANMVNKRAFDAAPESREVTSFGVPTLKPSESPSGSDDEDDTMDFQAALAESRKNKRKISPPPRRKLVTSKAVDPAREVAKQAGFSGPLPFEKLDLGSSLLGRKKMQQRAEETAGGFENPELEKHEERKKAEPLPPWFSGNIDEDIQKQRELEGEDRERAKEFNRHFQFQKRGEGGFGRHDTGEIIDLEAEEEKRFKHGEVIDLEADDGQTTSTNGTSLFDPKIRMGDVAEKMRVEPPQPADDGRQGAVSSSEAHPPGLRLDEGEEDEGGTARSITPGKMYPQPTVIEEDLSSQTNSGKSSVEQPTRDEEMLDWSESDHEEDKDAATRQQEPDSGAVAHEIQQASRSPSIEFEDVGIPDRPKSPSNEVQNRAQDETVVPTSGIVHPESLSDGEADDFDDFSDPEDEELLRALTLEAEEHARFASTLNNKTQAQNVADYEKELRQLRNQQKKDRRDADEVTHIMIQECQQLLRLFGLPYITAPMEAEAQCAELVKLGLVDGIVTDDSDCFLFGGTRIYKNMFNQAKFVECYLTSDMEKEFDLTRDKLISVAHLLGSDYTEGLPGVGPVTALEILGEFGTLDEFKSWLNGVQMNTITKADDAGNPFRKKFRRNATKLFLPPSFPDARVTVAYNNPDVDSDPEQFQWGVPDLDALRSFLMATIGWSQERTDEVLVPVIRDMNRRADEGTQSNITAFFDGGVGIGVAGASKGSSRGEGFAPRKRVAESSKRMGSALSRMAEKAKIGRVEPVPGTEIGGGMDGSASHNSTIEPRKTKHSTLGKASKQSPAVASDEDGSDFEAPTTRQKKRKTARAKEAQSRRKN